MPGRIEAIFTSAESGAPMQSAEQATAVAHKGIVGDRNFRDDAGSSRGTPANEITLIEAEAIEAARRDYSIQLEPAETRRNLLTSGVALNHLVGRRFRVGRVVLRGLELCEPCKHLEKLTRQGVMRALLHRGGLRAEVIEGGTIALNDSITAEPM